MEYLPNVLQVITYLILYNIIILSSIIRSLSFIKDVSTHFILSFPNNWYNNIFFLNNYKFTDDNTLFYYKDLTKGKLHLEFSVDYLQTFCFLVNGKSCKHVVQVIQFHTYL